MKKVTAVEISTPMKCPAIVEAVATGIAAIYHATSNFGSGIQDRQAAVRCIAAYFNMTASPTTEAA